MMPLIFFFFFFNTVYTSSAFARHTALDIKTIQLDVRIFSDPPHVGNALKNAASLYLTPSFFPVLSCMCDWKMEQDGCGSS